MPGLQPSGGPRLARARGCTDRFCVPSSGRAAKNALGTYRVIPSDRALTRWHNRFGIVVATERDAALVSPYGVRSA
jgi:hypothetical protein